MKDPKGPTGCFCRQITFFWSMDSRIERQTRRPYGSCSLFKGLGIAMLSIPKGDVYGTKMEPCYQTQDPWILFRHYRHPPTPDDPGWRLISESTRRSNSSSRAAGSHRSSQGPNEKFVEDIQNLRKNWLMSPNKSACAKSTSWMKKS